MQEDMDKPQDLVFGNKDGAGSVTEEILDTVKESFFCLDHHWRFTYLNKEAEEHFGKPASDLLGVDIREHGKDVADPAFFAGCEWGMIEGKPVQFEAFCKNKNTWYDIAVYPHNHGLIVHLHNSTEQKQADKALKESREDLNHAQTVAKTGSWRLNSRTNQLLWSDETYHLFGIPRETQLSYESFLANVHPEDRNYVDEKWQAALTGNGYDIEHRIVVAGVVKWVRERAELEFDETGQLLGGFGTVQDITERKEQEQELQEHLKREQRIAATLQEALVPSNFPKEINGFKFAVRYKSALREAEIGGDFYDIFDLGDGRVCVMIGDVAGKGLYAAMRVAAARYAIRSYAFIEPKPSRILTLANQALCCADEDRNMLTAFLVIVDTRSGTVVYSNAGHEPPILLDPNGNIEELVVPGAALGVLPGLNYSEGTCRLGYGGRIIMITDGITEARKPQIEFYGKERVLKHLQQNRSAPSPELIRSLLNAATDFAGGELQDDAAIVMIEHTGI